MESWEEHIAVRENPCDAQGRHVVVYMNYHFRFEQTDKCNAGTIVDWVISNVAVDDVNWQRNHGGILFKPPFTISFKHRTDALKFRLSATW